MMNQLNDIVDSVRTEFTAISTLRDATLNQSRALIRSCANSIRAIHRHEWAEAEAMLAQASADADVMVEPLRARPTLYHAGYTQDSLKELVEAHVLFAVARGQDLPDPAYLFVTGATYLKGLCEAASETRRFVLDLMRRGRVTEAEPYLDFMDEVYSHLITVDFPDAVTDGLRRSTDALRGVLERTRGDLTMAIRQDQMRVALQTFGGQLDKRLGTQFASEANELLENSDNAGNEGE